MLSSFSLKLAAVWCLIFCLKLTSQNEQRPFIWVKQENRNVILNKIEKETWAKTFYTDFKNRIDKELASYKKSKESFLKKIPFDWSKQKAGKTPPLKIYQESTNSNQPDRSQQIRYMQMGVDCGVMYFLTQEEVYAQCASDILYAYVEGLLQMKPSDDTANGGWIFPTDHLREARVVGAQLPIIYDFVASYLYKNKEVFDLGKNNTATFSDENAQQVFLTYAKLAAEHGQLGSNWSVLESFSLVQNALALNDLELREKYLNVYLKEGTNKQESLLDISERYKNEGDVYPETSQYSNAVADFTTRLLIILNNYDNNLHLGQKHYKIPFSLDRWNSVRYPNDDIIRFGDGHRKYSEPLVSYDMAYHLGKQDKVSILTEKFGPLITDALKSGQYKKDKVGSRSVGVTVYFEPTELLWLEENKEYPTENVKLPRTDQFSHAGVYLQRNVSSNNNPEDGLMCFVGGAHMVHGHANGMDMELYGLGEVLGVDHGRGAYKTDLHENYSRLFAAHNTVVVNGSSRGQGGWVGLKINTTELIAMEPMPLKEALSPNHSFVRTSFLDDKGDEAEATQERTMAIIRTSPTSGYYMDVFRSKSALPNEYHDYLYHNFGDDLEFFNSDLLLVDDELRYMASANKPYKYNGQYKNPGWHFFKEVKTSYKYAKDVKARFSITKLKDEKNRYMNLFILGCPNREYTKVKAPVTFEAPRPYHDSPTPTLVVRQNGEAWDNPFAVIFEPTFNENSNKGILSVTKLETNGLFKGFKVVSKIDKKLITQYIINQASNLNYENKEMKFRFSGAFAVLTYDEKDKLQNIYIGEGQSLTCKDLEVTSKDAQPIAGYIDLNSLDKKINATENASVLIK